VYLNFSIKEAIENEQTQSNIEYVSENTSNFYTTYLAEKVDYVWNDIFIDLIWNSFTDNMGRLKSGELTTVELAAPTIVIPE